LPLGVNDGFLPVENGTGQGIGSVSFDVTPKAGLASGTTISNTATVVFDTNAPIATNTTTNTIDAGAPTSHVRPFPPVEKQASFRPGQAHGRLRWGRRQTAPIQLQ
jgi:hypothetical protein